MRLKSPKKNNLFFIKEHWEKICLVPVFFFLFSFFSLPKQQFPIVNNPQPNVFVTKKILKKGLDGDLAFIRHIFNVWEKRAEDLRKQNLNTILGFNDLLLKIKGIPANNPPLTLCIFPQSYASFAFIQCLGHENHITLLPSGIKRFSFLSCQEKSEDMFYDSEIFFRKNISLAFIAPYSNPWTVKRLKNQKIPFVRLPSLRTFEEVKNALQTVASSLDTPEKGQLLSLFLEGAKRALKNESKLAKHKNALFLHAGCRLSLPHPGTLSYERLVDFGLYDKTPGKELTYEEIAKIDPDLIILSCFRSRETESQKSKLVKLKELRCVKEGRVFFIDDNLQQFPSQHAIFADLELVEALLSSA